MSGQVGKVVVNLATGHEDADRVTVAFLIAGAALEQGRPVVVFATKEAVRLGVPGYAEAIEISGGPPLGRLFAQFAAAGGEIYLCPICFKARDLDPDALVANARVAGGTPLWEWIGAGDATVFSY